MTVSPASASAWTCPFCPLVCDDVRVTSVGDGTGLELAGGPCERAAHALGSFAADAGAPAFIDGVPSSLDDAIAAAAQRLAVSRQPLFAGLGTDVDGARALYPLACASGAIVDAAGGDALAEGLRALQDRGQFTTTLAEVRTRADLIVFVGALPLAQAPRLRERLGIGDPQVAQRHVVTLCGGAGADAAVAGGAGPGVSAEALACGADLFDTLARLGVAVGRAPDGVAGDARGHPIDALARRLHAARYAVLVGMPAALPPQAGLLIELVHRIVHQLNRTTRAAALWIGGGQGAATANQVWTWLGGLPLRTRAGPHGLEHEPRAFGAERVLADGAADLLLWVSAFDAQARPPSTALPLVALAHPAQAEACRRPGAVFIGVGTPGVDHPGHLFRTDGTVLMPLRAARAGAAPTVAEVARRLNARRAEAMAAGAAGSAR